ncbi:IS1 family transposase [Carnimonas bestiolae]
MLCKSLILCSAIASVNVHCSCCHSSKVYRHGQNTKSHHRFR